jgi:hypothetical protein
MFKKPIKTSSDNLISGKDKKKLKADLGKLYDQKSVDHLIDSNKELSSQKVSGGKMVLYVNETFPLLADATGKGDYFPTRENIPHIASNTQIYSILDANFSPM